MRIFIGYPQLKGHDFVSEKVFGGELFYLCFMEIPNKNSIQGWCISKLSKRQYEDLKNDGKTKGSVIELATVLDSDPEVAFKQILPLLEKNK